MQAWDGDQVPGAHGKTEHEAALLLILTVVGRWAEAGRFQELTSYQIVSFQFGRRPCLKTIKQRAIGEDT